MNTANTLHDPEASMVNSRQKSQIGARVLWIIALIGPVPFVLAPILTALSRIESLPVYMFCLSAWAAAFLIFGSIVRSRWDRNWCFPRTRTSQILATAGFVCQVVALYLSSSPAAVLGWVLFSGAWLSTHAGETHSGRWKLLSHWPALCMLLQVPHVVVTRLDQAYQQVLTHTVARCLDLLGIPFRRDHSQFEFARFVLSVDEILISSPFIGWMLFVSCLVFSWLYRPIVLLPAYLGAAMFWAFGMHLVQLCTIGFLRHSYDFDVGAGWLFVLLNMTTVLAAIGLVLSTDRCLRILFMPVPMEDSSNQSFNPISRVWNRMLLPLATDKHAATSNSGLGHTSAVAGIRTRHLLNPWRWCRWSISFAFDWIFSRPYSVGITACPALSFGIALIAVVALTTTDQSQLRESRYRVLFDESVKQKDFVLASVVLKVLIDCNADSVDLKYRQALLDQMRGNNLVAVERMEHLATSKNHGLAAMWTIAQVFNLQELRTWTANDHDRFRKLMEIGLSNLTDENLLSTKVLMFSYLAEIGAYSDAERYLAEVVPARPELALAAASLCRSQQDTAGVAQYAMIAQRHFESKLSRKPSDILSRIDLARVLMIQTKFEDAAKLLNDGYRLTKDSRLANVTGEALVMWSNHLGNGDTSSKNLVKRLQVLHAAIGVAPSDPLVGSSIAQLLIDCRDNRSPEVVLLKKAILEGADPVANHFVRGTLALLDGHTTEAKTQLELALEREPNAPVILNNLAVALAQKNDDLEKALSLVNKAIEKWPNHSYFLETRGQIHLKLAHWQDAISDLEQALDTQELRPEIYPSLAAAYEKTGAKDMTDLYRKLASETRAH